jgi:predicted DNA-binding transcriptional regulator AlpA
MSLVPDRDVPVRASEEARLLILAQARSLRLALEDLHAARRGGLLTFAAPNPELAGLSDLEMLTLLVRDPTQLPLVPPGRIPTLIGLVRLLEARLVQSELQPRPSPRSSVSPQEPSDRLLTPQEAAQLLGVTVRWLYRRADKLPFGRRLSRKTLRFSEAGLRRYLSVRKA